MILGRLLLGIAAVAVGAIATVATVKYINGVLTRRKLANLANQDGIRRAIVDTVNRCSNRVSLSDLDSNRKVSYQSNDGIADDIDEGMYL